MQLYLPTELFRALVSGLKRALFMGLPLLIFIHRSYFNDQEPPESPLSEGAGRGCDESQRGLLLRPWKIVPPQLHV